MVQIQILQDLTRGSCEIILNSNHKQEIRPRPRTSTRKLFATVVEPVSQLRLDTIIPSTRRLLTASNHSCREMPTMSLQIVCPLPPNKQTFTRTSLIAPHLHSPIVQFKHHKANAIIYNCDISQQLKTNKQNRLLACHTGRLESDHTSDT
ncbi:MAG: hypothetical protein MHMPM18_001024 [Marteilia pararefringens]